MLCSLDDTLQAVARHLPSGLVPAGGLTGVSAAARRVPDAVSHHFRLACGLGRQERPPALVLKIASSPGRDILAGRHSTFTLPPGLDDAPGWRRARELCRLWADPSLPLHHAVQGVWLRFAGETDAGAGPEWISCFLAPETAPGEAEARAAWILGTVVPLLRGAPPPPALARALEAARGHAELLQVGVCPDADGIRLCLYPPSQDELSACLAALGWSGLAAESGGLLSLLARAGAQLCLSVELAAALPRLAVECHLNGLPGPEKRLAWDALLAILEESGLCTESQRRSLLAFPGHTVEDFFVPRAVIRALQHVEVLLEAGLPALAVVYLGSTSRPLATLDGPAEEER